MQARILPYLDQANAYNNIDLSAAYDDSENSGSGITTLRVAGYLCPSEINDRARTNSSGVPIHYPVNYAFNGGTWMVWNVQNRRQGNGAFAPNSGFSTRDMTDGTSNTLGLSEVKAFTPYTRDGQTGMAAVPTTSLEVETLIAGGGEHKPDSGHTEWVDGRVHQTGFTATLPPNTYVVVPGGVRDEGDYTSCREDKNCDTPTYAAVTSRSWHEGLVISLLMDGSVRSISENINQDTWRYLAQRDDGQVVGEF